jgi:hypothetical protein
MIGKNQNEERQIQRLAAQRKLYSTAKNIYGWQVALAGPVAVGTAILVLLLPISKVYVASWALLVVLLDTFWLTPWQKSLRGAAARIQEAFDCDVLQLDWNDLKAGKRVDPELEKAQSRKYEMSGGDMPTLRNWYPIQVDEVPIHVGRIICQRTNCWWDSTQRRHYASWIVGAVAFISIVIFGLALIGGVSVEALVLKGLLPAAPMLLIGLRQYTEQREAADRLDALKDHCGGLWRRALSGASNTELTRLARNLQDEILENRRKTPPVLDAIFKRLRNDYEANAIYAAGHYIAEAKAALRIA